MKIFVGKNKEKKAKRLKIDLRVLETQQLHA